MSAQTFPDCDWNHPFGTTNWTPAVAEARRVADSTPVPTRRSIYLDALIVSRALDAEESQTTPVGACGVAAPAGATST